MFGSIYVKYFEQILCNYVQYDDIEINQFGTRKRIYIYFITIIMIIMIIMIKFPVKFKIVLCK